jgi:hypothetical protein
MKLGGSTRIQKVGTNHFVLMKHRFLAPEFMSDMSPTDRLMLYRSSVTRGDHWQNGQQSRDTSGSLGVRPVGTRVVLGI